MGWFKKPVKVKCYSKEEIGKLINWLRHDSGLVELNRQRYQITVVMAMQYWDDPEEVLYFEIEIPYSMFKPLREKLIQQEAFDPVLEQRAFAQLLGREL